MTLQRHLTFSTVFSVNSVALRHVTPCSFILKPDNVSEEGFPFLLSSKAEDFSEMLFLYKANGVTFKKSKFFHGNYCENQKRHKLCADM